MKINERFDVVIIGAGLGGLLCGNILARHGMKVCIVEKNIKTGGSLQVFARNKCLFNTGLNYTEGLAEGQILNRYFRYFGILDKLKLKQMDPDGFEIITFKGKEYRFAQGDQHFAETLGRAFPDEQKAINTYIQELKTLCYKFPLYNLDIQDYHSIRYDELFSTSVTEFLSTLTPNETLQNVLAGNNLLYAGVPDKTPLYLHALITYSFISSSWRLVDGSQHLASVIGKTITDRGGIIMRGKEVQKLHICNGAVISAELSDGMTLEADIYISNMHPAATLKLTEETTAGTFYRKRILNLENTIGMFSVYMVLQDNVFPYMNYNHYFYNGDSVWTTASYDERTWPQSFFLYTPTTSRSEHFADGLIAMTYMKWDELLQWEHTTVEKRGVEYEAFKKEKAEKLIQLVEQKFPGIRSKIKAVYTSTPLTWRDYTGTPQGSAYGILKDYHAPLKSLIMPRSKIKNLYFTGQNLNVHGILGVTIGAVMTCSELPGLENILDEIRNV